MPPTIPDQLYGSPIVTTQTPDYSLYAPGMKGKFAMTSPGEPSITAYLAAHQSEIESITSGILTITGQILNSVADLKVQTAGLHNAEALSHLRQAAAKNEIVRVLTMRMQETESLQRTAQRLLEQAPQEQKAMYQLANQYNAANKAAISKQLQEQTRAVAEEMNRSTKAITDASAQTAKAKILTNVSKGLSIAGYALSFKIILSKYYAAVTEGTEEARSQYVESILSFGINLGLATVGGAAAGATSGAIGGVWGIVAGALVCGVFAFLDFIVSGITGKSIARHFMDFCDTVANWAEYVATKAAEKIVPVVKPTLMDWIQWEVGDFMDILPIRF